jgi:4-diphosphocytidyl-2-C-methyl-D-erythritol kinase
VTRPARAPGASRRRADVREATVRAQAKINLYLRVLAREDGGYHQLETLMQRLALGDRVRVRVGPGVAGRTLDCRGPALPPGGLGPVERNLAYRAAVAFAEATGWPDAFAIAVEKEVPVGGGLGGGSADAGAVLRCLNALAPEALAPGRAARARRAARRRRAVPHGRGAARARVGARGAHVGAAAAARAAGAPGLLRRGGGDARGVRRARGVAPGDGRAPAARAVDARAADAVGRRGARGRERLRAGGAPGARRRRRGATALRRRGAAGGAAQRPRRPAGEEGAPDGPPPAGDRAPIALMSGSGATVFLLTPLAGVEVGLEVAAPADAAGTPAVRVVETRTARRVARVQVRG